MTIAERYNAKVDEIMPHMADDLKVGQDVTRACDIDEIIFRKSEFLGGMACVILRIVQQESEA